MSNGTHPEYPAKSMSMAINKELYRNKVSQFPVSKMHIFSKVSPGYVFIVYAAF